MSEHVNDEVENIDNGDETDSQGLYDNDNDKVVNKLKKSQIRRRMTTTMTCTKMIIMMPIVSITRTMSVMNSANTAEIMKYTNNVDKCDGKEEMEDLDKNGDESDCAKDNNSNEKSHQGQRHQQNKINRRCKTMMMTYQVMITIQSKNW